MECAASTACDLGPKRATSRSPRLNQGSGREVAEPEPMRRYDFALSGGVGRGGGPRLGVRMLAPAREEPRAARARPHGLHASPLSDVPELRTRA
jgi:hypothetical protein